MRNALLGGLAVLALSGTLRAQDVSYDFDPGTDFSRFKTYAWTKGTPVEDELNHKRIVASIESRLLAKGMVRAEPGQRPDLLVAYHTKFDKSVRIFGHMSDIGFRWGLNRTGTARADNVTVGTLVVDLMDGPSGRLVWRGIATRDVDPTQDAEKRDKSINKATEKLFKNYPPRG